MSSKRFTPDVIARAEELVGRIQGISSCRITTDDAGEITEVHVVAEGRKPAKLVARDVETCLKAELSIHVDYKKIGVVIFDSAEGTAVMEKQPMRKSLDENHSGYNRIVGKMPAKEKFRVRIRFIADYLFVRIRLE